MVNIPPIKQGTEIKTQLLPDVTKTWQVGQLLSATTETGGDALSKVVLRIGQQLFEARTPIPLKTGDSIQLIIKSLGEQPIFKIQGQQNISALAAEKLKNFIARQGSMKSLMEQLPKFDSSKVLSTPGKQLLRTLAQLQATPSQLSQVSELKQTIHRSGYFHESAISKNPMNSQQDIKAQLLKLSTQIASDLPKLPADLKPSDPQFLTRAIQQFTEAHISPQQLAVALSSKMPLTQLQTLVDVLSQGQKLPALASLPNELQLLVTHIQQSRNGNQFKQTLFSLLRSLPLLLELRSAVETSIARLTSQQLMPMTREADNPLLWLLEIPVKDDKENQLLRFRIEQEHSASADGHDNWSVTIHFDFATLGLIQARIHLVADTLSSVFHADKKQTEVLIQNNLPLLELALIEQGFRDIRLDISKQKLTEAKQLTENIHILDEKA
ncbi:MAG: flagellar hook-length control protein FliK [Gammaproteobacteria bacterium]